MKNYIFQSQIGPNFGIKSINEDLLTRLDTSSPSHTVSCKSKFCDSDISYAIVNVNGCVALYTPGGTGIVTLYPWNYDTPNFYSDKNVSDQINLGKRLKKCGVWVGNTQSGTYIKWRFLASNISIVQYEFDCMIYESGVIEWGYSSFNSVTTTKNYFNYSESGTANCYVIGYIGNIRTYKNIEFVLNSYLILRKKRNDIYCIIAGINQDNKALGACYVLGALTIVNENAATALPWLYQSFSYF